MASNLSAVSFPLPKDGILEFVINYRFISKTEKVNSKLTLTFNIVENSLKENPRVEVLVQEFLSLMHKCILPVLGKNTQITSLTFKTSTMSTTIPIYLFGSASSPSLTSDKTLFFLLQSFGKTTAFRLYLKGAASEFARSPLPENSRLILSSFENLFTAVFSMLEGNLQIQFVKERSSILVCVFRECVKLESRAKQLSGKTLKKTFPKKRVQIKKRLKPSLK